MQINAAGDAMLQPHGFISHAQHTARCRAYCCTSMVQDILHLFCRPCGAASATMCKKTHMPEGNCNSYSLSQDLHITARTA
jgi:hypothetical protein